MDDDEGMTSFFAQWSEIGGYFCIANDTDESELYCEFCDQSNGFYSKTISYSLFEDKVVFHLGQNEIFSLAVNIKEVTIFFPQGRKKEIVSCLSRLFFQ
jgi:hypothetical protein